MPIKKAKHNMPIKERFERFFVRGQNDKCWLWLGCLDEKGYGNFPIKNRSRNRSHRASYEIYVGPIPKGMHVLHSCDNAACVNPAHLAVGTNQQNQDQAWQRGRKRAVQKLTPSDVIAIRQSGEMQKVLAARFGVHQCEISRIRTGVRGRGIMLELGSRSAPCPSGD